MDVSCLPQQCLKIGVKPGDSRNEPSSLGKQPRSFFWSLHGHYEVTTRSLRFSFRNGSSFEPTLNGSSFGPILRSFRSRMLRVAFQIRFRYVSNLVSWLKSSRANTRSFWSRICVVAFQIRYQFHEWLKFRADTRIIWSRMPRGCVPDSVSRRFEFSLFMAQVSSRYSDHFGHVCSGRSRFGFATFRIQFHEWLKFRAVLGSFWCCYACRKTGTGKPSSTSSLMCEAAACLNA